MDQRDENDDLAAFRGILFALVGGLVGWAVIALVVVLIANIFEVM
jgi:hypothetical protein